MAGEVRVDSTNQISRQIEKSADLYQPAVYQLLSFYHALDTQSEPLDGNFIPMTSVQARNEQRSQLFAIGLIPPSSSVSARLLDRSASVRALEGGNDTLIEEKPDVGSSSTGDLPGETGGIATSTTPPIGPTQSDNPDFWVQYVTMCNRLGCQPEELARVIQSESNFNPAAGAKNKAGVVTAKGLIQFVHGTAIGIGMTEDEYTNLQKMSAKDQLKWVERFYKNRSKGRNAFQLKAVTLGGYNNPDGSVYSSLATSPEFRQPDRQKQAYLRNAHLDLPPPPKGFITPEDLAARLAKKPLSAANRANIDRARTTLGMSTNYTPFQPDGASTPRWAKGGAANANKASKTSSLVANTSMNKSNLGKQFMAAQSAMINQMIKALETIANTPPLRMLVNPQSFRVSSEKLISDGNWGRSGPIIEHWGDNQDKIEGSGKIAAYYSMDGYNATGPGINRTARQFSTSYQNLLSLWLIYKNNGGVWIDDPIVPVGKAKNLSVVGSVYIYYDSILYIGSFDSFSITESESQPYSVEYQFSFTVRSWFLLDHLDDSQYMYGKPTATPAKPTTNTNSSPLSATREALAFTPNPVTEADLALLQPNSAVPLPPISDAEADAIINASFANNNAFPELEG